MKACRHDWQVEHSKLDVIFVIDYWQGPTDAVLECRACGACSLLRLLHWSGRNLSNRVFAVQDLDRHTVQVFLRNMKSDYCDLSRHGAEVDALVASAGAVEGGVIVTVPDMRVAARLDNAEIGRPVIVSWRKVAPEEQDPFWQSVLDRHSSSSRPNHGNG